MRRTVIRIAIAAALIGFMVGCVFAAAALFVLTGVGI